MKILCVFLCVFLYDVTVSYTPDAGSEAVWSECGDKSSIQTENSSPKEYTVEKTLRSKRHSDDEEYSETEEDLSQEDDSGGGHSSQTYSRGGRRGRKRDNHSSSRKKSTHRKRKLNRVTMPSGKKFYIIRPDMSKMKCGDPAKLILLNPTGHMGKREYKIVADEFQAAAPNMKFNIIKIEKVLNGCLWMKYRKRQAVVHSEAGLVDERMLFHGSTYINQLIETGFDERYARSGTFGYGLYYSPQSSLSSSFSSPINANGERQMLLCRVTHGKIYTTQAPTVGWSHPPPGYHSLQGGHVGGQVYQEHIVYRGEQVYPQYLITFKV